MSEKGNFKKMQYLKKVKWNIKHKVTQREKRANCLIPWLLNKFRTGIMNGHNEILK